MKANVAAVFLLPAAILVADAARAADLPLAADPVDYVRVCDAYGDGFLYIPGTETCLRVRGRARADYNGYVTPQDDLLDAIGVTAADRPSYRFRARANIYLDARTETELGLLRTFIEYEITADSLDNGDGAPETDVSLEAAYIEYAGFTFGRIQSFYDFLDVAYTPAQTFDPAYSDTVQNVIAYTRSFGAVSATLALEDTSTRRYGVAEGRYGGTQIPDVVGVLRYEDEAVGAAQLMAASHYVNAIGIVTPRNPAKAQLRVTDEEYGFAVGGGASLNVPVGNGTKVGATASYAVGALAYLSADIQSQYDVFDAAFGPAAGRPISRSLSLSDGFSVSGGFETEFTPKITLGVSLGYLSVDVPNAATDLDEDGRRDDLDVDNYDAQAFIGYEPVDDFLLGVGAEYRLIETKGFEDGSVFTGYFRAQRAF